MAWVDLGILGQQKKSRKRIAEYPPQLNRDDTNQLVRLCVRFKGIHPWVRKSALSATSYGFERVVRSGVGCASCVEPAAARKGCVLYSPVFDPRITNALWLNLFVD